jgi:hypothetical protein
MVQVQDATLVTTVGTVGILQQNDKIMPTLTVTSPQLPMVTICAAAHLKHQDLASPEEPYTSSGGELHHNSKMQTASCNRKHTAVCCTTTMLGQWHMWCCHECLSPDTCLVYMPWLQLHVIKANRRSAVHPHLRTSSSKAPAVCGTTATGVKHRARNHNMGSSARH